MSFLDGWKRRREIAAIQEELRLTELKAAKTLLEASVDDIEKDPDESSWRMIIHGAKTLGDQWDLTGVNLDDLRRISRRMALTNSHYKGILQNNKNYIVGHGIIISADPDDPQKDHKDEQWRRFKAGNDWHNRCKEIVLRAFRDGECFLRFNGDGESAKVRFLEPEWIMDPSNKATYGIVSDDDDVETIKAYLYSPGDSNEAETIPAEEVLFIKMLADSSQKRGVAYYWSELVKLADMDTWYKNLLVYQKVSLAVVLLRKHAEGIGPTAIKGFADTQKTDTRFNAKTGRYDRYQQIKAGTIIDTPHGVEYEWQGPKLDARPIVEGARAILLAVAAGANQTEPMVTGDASNANFASTMVAEAPAIKSYESWQEFFGECFCQVWRKVTVTAIDDKFQPVFTPPGLVSREPEKEAKANEVLHQKEVLSRKTWQKKAGLDPEEVKRNVNEERAEAVATLPEPLKPQAGQPSPAKEVPEKEAGAEK